MSPNTLFGIILFIAFAFFGGSFTIVKAWDIDHLKDILEDCQKDLPRSQKCELVAVVKK